MWVRRSVGLWEADCLTRTRQPGPSCPHAASTIRGVVAAGAPKLHATAFVALLPPALARLRRGEHTALAAAATLARPKRLVGPRSFAFPSGAAAPAAGAHPTAAATHLAAGPTVPRRLPLHGPMHVRDVARRHRLNAAGSRRIRARMLRFTMHLTASKTGRDRV